MVVPVAVTVVMTMVLTMAFIVALTMAARSGICCSVFVGIAHKESIANGVVVSYLHFFGPKVRWAAS